MLLTPLDVKAGHWSVVMIWSLMSYAVMKLHLSVGIRVPLMHFESKERGEVCNTFKESCRKTGIKICFKTKFEKSNNSTRRRKSLSVVQISYVCTFWVHLVNKNVS